MTEDEHLKKIVAKCERNLSLCETNRAYDFHTSEDSTAGWRVTVVAIKSVTCDFEYKYWELSATSCRMLKDIIKAWPEELL